ncbi:MAG: hypothetical protein FJY82_13235 [Candidatus Aminicenantes bacterium]|nr:hypothetical protein [Candidatus Aminicenantes bacterium]
MVLPAVVASLLLFLPMAPGGGAVPDMSSRAHLLRVFDEVRAMGARPGENLIQQEFFAGGPDDDDTNKDLHVVVLIQPETGMAKMTVQVTRFERDRRDRNVKTARETNTIRAEIINRSVKDLTSDYEEGALHEILEQVQMAVIQKKRLLLEKR